MDILYFKDLGDTSVVSECSLGVNLVIDNIFDIIKFESNRTITYGDIAFWVLIYSSTIICMYM